MFGVVQGGGPGAGVAAPFANPSSHPSRTMAAKSNKEKHTTLVPFRDDTRLVALRYDQTVALEPPIPLPPPRSPLRPPPRASSFNLAAPVVSAPPVPPPRPPPPTEQHPALRTISTPRSFDSDRKRDSVNASTESYRSYGSYAYAYAYYEADSSDEEDDPFAYEKIDAVQNVRPLQLRSNSTGSSIYSLHERERIFNSPAGQNRGYFPRYQRESERGFEREREKEREEKQKEKESAAKAREVGSERVSEADSRPSDVSLSPALSISSSTASPGLPASPATPPPQFSKRFARSFIRRSGSQKSSSTSSSSMKRLRKKSQNEGERIGDGGGRSGNGNGGDGRSGSTISGPQQVVERYAANTISTNTTGTTSMAMAQAHSSHSRSLSSSSSASASASASASTSSPLPLPRSHSRRATNPIHAANPSNNNDKTSPSATSYNSNAGPASPVISTTIPCESFFEEDDLSKLSFSIRGSLIFGGKRPWRSGSTSSHKMAERDVILEQPSSANTKTRVFPLVPSASKKDHAGPPPARPPRDDDMGVAAMIPKPFKIPESPHHQSPQLETVNDNTSTSHKLPPSIRVISAEAEKESQKVRSLYESGEALQLGDGDVPWPLEPPPEVPSDVDDNDAPNDQLPGHPTQTSASTSSPAPPGSRALAGGIEDWEGIRGHDVDRYGFIVPRNPGSPPNTATGTGSSPIRFSSRKHRNVLTRKDVASLSLSAKRGPTKKMSARSLNTHTSEFSVLSRRSVRSTIRQATNRLPHNKDRRLIDEAGDLLAMQPGLSHIAEYEAVEKLTAELKRKEVKRTEKWRKMAKIVRPGSEGQGTVFQFDSKNPKLIERTWKGIPDCWRSAAWYSFLASSAKADPINYVSDDELTAAFRRLVNEPSPDDIQIDLDVPRTINQHIMFRRRYRGGQRLLFRVLHALSLYFPETGYVQGMAPLATTLLSYYDEEQCFIMLVRLWQFRGLNRIYQSGFVELIGALKDFEKYWLNEKDVAEMLRELCIDPTAYATRWYLTLFNLSIPFPVQLRIWDVFMLLGSSPPDQLENSSGAGKEVDGHPSSRGLEILHAASLAIIDTLHATLVDSDFENAMKSLTSWVPIKDEQKFLEVVQIEWKKHQTRQKKKT